MEIDTKIFIKNHFGNTSTTTPPEAIGCCKEYGILCKNATKNGYCKITGCNNQEVWKIKMKRYQKREYNDGAGIFGIVQ